MSSTSSMKFFYTRHSARLAGRRCPPPACARGSRQAMRPSPAAHAAAGLRLARNAISLPLLPPGADEAPSAPPEWVHLIPAGIFSGRDGRGPYLLDAQAVLDAFAAHGADLPIDYDHQSLSADEKTRPRPPPGGSKSSRRARMASGRGWSGRRARPSCSSTASTATCRLFSATAHRMAR